MQKTKSLQTVTKIMLFTAFIVCLVACNGQQDAAQEKTKSSAVGNEVKPPQIDIHTAVLTENLPALKQHIAAGSNLNEKDPFGGSSPLITAAVFGKTVEARALIEAGADINFQNKDGSTALHTATFFCRPEIVKMLLANSADKTIRNTYGATAYESVAGPFSEVKNSYDIMGKVLGPMGLKLDYEYIQNTRPEIAAMLK